MIKHIVEVNINENQFILICVACLMAFCLILSGVDKDYGCSCEKYNDIEEYSKSQHKWIMVHHDKPVCSFIHHHCLN
jgi:hypothetical protein